MDPSTELLTPRRICSTTPGPARIAGLRRALPTAKIAEEKEACNAHDTNLDGDEVGTTLVCSCLAALQTGEIQPPLHSADLGRQVILGFSKGNANPENGVP